jgi:hypothetical protein
MVMQVAALDILTTKGRFAPEVARAIGEAMDLQIESSYEKLATNQRLNEVHTTLQARIDEVRAELLAKISELRTELKGDIAALDHRISQVHAELKGEIAALRHEIDAKLAATKAEILRWMFVAMTGQTALLIGIMRLFMPHGP